MTLDDFRSDDRALALGIVVFISMLVIAAVLYIVLNMGFVEVFDLTSSQAESDGARDQINMAQTIWSNIMFVSLFLAALFLVARAVREGALR